MAKDILRNRHASVKFAKENNMEWLELESEYVWVYLLAYLAVLFFQKKISNDTTSSLPKYLSNFPYFTGFSAHSLVK